MWWRGFDGRAYDLRRDIIIIASLGFERDLAQSNATPGGKIHLGVILGEPARREKLRINVLARLLFGRHAWTL